MPEEQPVISTAFETLMTLPFYYGQRDPARTFGVVKDGLVGHLGARRIEGVLARVEVALPARVGARRDLHPHPVPWEEGDACRPQVYDVLVDLAGLDGRRRDLAYHTGRGVALPGASAQEAVGDADRPPVRIHVDEPRHEVRVRGRGGRKQRGVDGT